MKTIIIKFQSALDALPKTFSEYTVIEIRSSKGDWIKFEARENSSVEAWENSSVEARGNSSVVARENSSVVARENSSVVARGNSSVEARENSSVVAWENSSVEARENSSVVARENSSVVARGNSGVHHYSTNVVLLFAFSVAWLFGKSKAKKKSKTATIITPKNSIGTRAWLAQQGVKIVSNKATLYKRVSKDFKTQEGEPHETKWSIGDKLKHEDPNLKGQECGAGKFHFCSRPYFCDEFRSIISDKYIAVSVPVKSLYAWPTPQYQHKIGGTEAKVLYECNRHGKKIS